MKRILVVEDDPVNATMLHDYLEAHGYAISVATSGPVGISMFKEQLPDLAIVDVLLPRINGFEVCFEIKRTAHGRKTPVFLMSAVYKDLERAEVYAKNDLQAQASFVKPFDLAQLLRRVQLFIGEA